jgi:hypothetical protein
VNRWRIAGAIALVLVALPALLASPSPAADVGSEEAFGLGELADRVEAGEGTEREVETVFASPAALRTEPDAATVLVPGAQRGLSPGEVRALETEMDPEGSVWLLDETGAAGEITEPNGVRVVPDPLLDPTSPYGDTRFVEAQARLDGETYELVLPSPTLLEVDDNRSQVLARAQDAVRDVDRSGQIEETDPSGDFPVAATLTVEDREVLVVADTGWVTNTALRDDNYDNAAFLDAMLADEPEGDVIVDASRHEPSRALTPVKAATQGLLWLATNWLALGLTGAGVVAGTVLAVRRAPGGDGLGHEHELGRYRGLTDEERETHVRRMLLRVLSEHGHKDPSELLGMSEDELEAESQRVLGTKEYLRAEGDMSQRYRNLRSLLQGGPEA